MGRSALVALVVTVLAGCTSRVELAQQPPALEFDTPAKLTDVRDCITAKNIYLTLVPFRDGWQFIQEEHGGDFAIFSLRLLPVPIGTHVELRTGKSLGQATLDQAVIPCIKDLPGYNAGWAR